MKIKDSIIIVTGASGGIGLATAKVLADKGAHVVLAARSADKLKNLEKEIPGSFAVPTDMTKPEDIARLIKKTEEKFGRIDILINNAGQGMRASVETIDLKDYHEVMELNVFAVVRAMQAVIPIMRRQGGGMISISALWFQRCISQSLPHIRLQNTLSMRSLSLRDRSSKRTRSWSASFIQR